MKVKEFLALPPEEQALEAAKCFVAKPWKHDVSNISTSTYSSFVCKRCRKKTPHRRTKQGCDINSDYYKFKEDPCLVPEPLAIDWNTAKRLQGECGFELFEPKLFDVFFNLGLDDYSRIARFELWAYNEALPIHFIAACMLEKGHVE